MSQNIIDKTVKAVYPVGTVLTFFDGTNPNESCLGTWDKVKEYRDILFFDSFCPYNKEITGTGSEGKTAILGNYFSDNCWIGGFVSDCPKGYKCVGRLGTMGYTVGAGTVQVWLNNKTVQVHTWSESSFIARAKTDWWDWDTLKPENTTYKYESNGQSGLNLYYGTNGDIYDWSINYITLDLVWQSKYITYQWVRTS